MESSLSQRLRRSPPDVVYTPIDVTSTPFDLTSTGRVIIAPFFGDVDTRAGNVLTYGSGVANGRPAFGVTWPEVGCYSRITTVLNIFQVVLIDRSDTGVGNFDIEFNYDQIQWETGQASGGSSACLGGSSARVGYSNGTGAPGTSLELPGSAVNGAFLDTGPAATALIQNSLNSGGQLGRYVFSVRSGLPTGFIDLEPATASNPTGTTHTVTATVRDSQLTPLQGEAVVFIVTAGPNLGDLGAAISDANGEATFTYTGDGGAGTDDIEASFVDPTGATRTARAEKTWVQTGDATPPRCEVIGVNIAHAPTPTNLLVEVQDTGSGLNAIIVLVANNATVNIPAFSVGTTSTVQVVADKIDESKRSRVKIQAIDVAGNSSTCDPVLATLTRDSRTLPLTGVSLRERYLTISPNGPDSSVVMANVNGTWFQFGVDQQSVTIDLGSAMTDGSDNTVTLWASSDTTILLADAVPKHASISPAARPWWHSAWSQAPVAAGG